MADLAYEDIKTGDEASLSVTITETHIVMYAGLTGDVNPVHVDAEHAKESIFGERIAHGMLVSGLISAVLGTQLPGPNSVYLGQDLKFTAPVKIGDTVTVVVTVTEKRDDKRIIKLHTTVLNQRGEMVIDGNAVSEEIGLVGRPRSGGRSGYPRRHADVGRCRRRADGIAIAAQARAVAAATEPTSDRR